MKQFAPYSSKIGAEITSDYEICILLEVTHENTFNMPNVVLCQQLSEENG